MHIAVIITCHNRKEKTLHCLTNLFEAKKAYGHNEVRLAVFLTDDGCTDGTAEAVDQALRPPRDTHHQRRRLTLLGRRHARGLA